MKSFYGVADRKDHREDGIVASHMPAWTQTKAKEHLKEQIGKNERTLKLQGLTLDDAHHIRQRLEKEKTRLHEVEKKPEFTPTELSELQTELKNLDDRVRDALFSEYEQEKRIASPQVVSDRNDLPCISLKSKDVAKACDVRKITEKGKISLNDADKIRQILYSYFDNPQYSRTYLRPKHFEGRKQVVSTCTTDEGRETFDNVFSKNKQLENQNKELLAKIESLEKKTDDLIKVKEVKKDKIYPTWDCPKCDFVGTTKQKGIHLAKHRREEIAREKEMVAV